MKSPTFLSLSALTLALTACMQEPPRERPAVSPAARVTGEAENCVQLSRINSTRIRDDYTIDFILGANKVYRNVLPNRCPGLRSDDAFTYETSLSQLCNTDIIYTLQRFGSDLRRGPGCGLGMFVPVELEE